MLDHTITDGRESMRLLRLGQALKALAEELAAARREIKRLDAENRRLRWSQQLGRSV